MKSDIWNNIIYCKDCNRKTKKVDIVKEGFRIRALECPGCGKTWYHPLDTNKYLQWKKVKKSRFSVKTRRVGNSWTISIPREIVRFSMIGNKREAVWSFENPKKLKIEFC